MSAAMSVPPWAQQSALGTIAGRLGYAWGPSGHSLLYVKGGTAWVQNRTEIDVNNLYFGFVPQPAPTTLANIQLGWAVGVGVEQAITPAWSLKLEYEYLGFASSNIATSPSVFFPPLGFPPGTTTSMTEQFHVIKLGLNYKVGMDPNAQWGAAPVSYPVKALPRKHGHRGGNLKVVRVIGIARASSNGTMPSNFLRLKF